MLVFAFMIIRLPFDMGLHQCMSHAHARTHACTHNTHGHTAHTLTFGSIFVTHIHICFTYLPVFIWHKYLIYVWHICLPIFDTHIRIYVWHIYIFLPWMHKRICITYLCLTSIYAWHKYNGLCLTHMCIPIYVWHTCIDFYLTDSSCHIKANKRMLASLPCSSLVFTSRSKDVRKDNSILKICPKPQRSSVHPTCWNCQNLAEFYYV